MALAAARIRFESWMAGVKASQIALLEFLQVESCSMSWRRSGCCPAMVVKLGLGLLGGGVGLWYAQGVK
jgi:hypothetical protein